MGMTPEKISDALSQMEAKLASLAYRSNETPSKDDRMSPIDDYDREETLNHCLWMCIKARSEFIPAGRTDKAMRWLCFVQGVCWSNGIFSIEEMKKFNAPDDAQVE